MKRLRRGMVGKLAACAIAMAVVFAIVGGISFASGEGNEPFLGDYVEYGIVCNHLNQTADMETNFVAGSYAGNGQHTGNTVSDDKANAAGMIRVGEVICVDGKSGTAKNVQLHSKSGVVYVDESVKKEVSDFLEKVKDYSKSVLKESDVDLVNVTDQNNYPIDVSKIDKKKVYVNADKLADDMISGRIQNGAIKITLREDQSIVLNISEDNKEFCIPRYSVKVADGSKTKEQIAQSVIWNMPNINNLIIGSDNMAATIIAPTAFVNIRTTGEGWLVCDTIVSNDGEWHMIYRHVPKVTPLPEESEKPTEKPTKKPTEEPTATPTEKPTKKPTATPTEEPTAPPTEEPTATPTEEPTAPPTEEPTATPTEEPTAPPTEEPTATPTEEPTATPTEEPTAPPTEEPTAPPTEEPTAPPTEEPTATPTEEPVITPVPTPTATPVPTPTATPFLTPPPAITPVPTPTATPVPTPTVTPDASSTPTPTPTATPFLTPPPAITPVPTPTPTATPYITPTPTPTEEPTATPTEEPTATPTEEPTATPTEEPTATPTEEPTATPTEEPTATPTEEPTAPPTEEPTEAPTEEPTATPEITVEPTPLPTDEVTPVPSEEPEVTPESSEEPEVTPESSEEPEVTPIPSENPEVTPSPTDNTIIDDPDVPRAKAKAKPTAKPESKLTTILDSDVPLSDSAPKTGDDTNLLIPLLGMGISALAVILVLVLRKKKN